jgi:hypothetical protein
MNPLLHQLVRQHEAELRERTAQARHRHDLSRTTTRARFARALLVVMARTSRRPEEVAAGDTAGPAGCLDPEPTGIRVVRRDRPGGAPAWRNATCANEEPLEAARDRGQDRPRQADVGYPLSFIEIPLKRRDD